MLYRIRARVVDAPGSLAALTRRCANAGLNILALQIHPELDAATDELVVDAPDDWTADAVAELVGGAGRGGVSVVACTTHDLFDPVTRWLCAAAEAADDPERLSELVGKLAGPASERSATEQLRVDALQTLVTVASGGGAPPATASAAAGSGSAVAYQLDPPGQVSARIGGHLVGRARLGEPEPDGVLAAVLEVAPAWRRLGIGSELLGRLTRLAAAAGAEDLVLRAAAGQEGVLELLAACGLRGRARMSEGALVVRIRLAGIRVA